MNKQNQKTGTQSQSLCELLSDEERAAMRAPIENAQTLPRRAFIDPGFFQYEKKHILRRSWLAVAFSSELAAPGDCVPLEVLGYPILLVRGSDGQLRAFHNVCPYDGCEVLITPKKGLAYLTTPYHGWQYGLDGTLCAAGYWDGTEASASLDLRALGADLHPVPCAEWFGTVFVWLEGEAQAFDSANRAVMEFCSRVDIDRLRVGRDENNHPQISEFRIDANWKTVYENYAVNVYHEHFVHAMYHKSPHVPRVDAGGNKTYTEVNDPSGLLGIHYDNSIGASFYGDSGLPPIRLRDGSANDRNCIINVFPNWAVTVIHNCARIALFLPHEVGRGAQRLATFFDVDAAGRASLLEERKRSEHQGISARKEDNAICESIQRARRSPAVSAQFYSPFWDNMHYTLSNLVLSRLEEGERRASND